MYNSYIYYKKTIVQFEYLPTSRYKVLNLCAFFESGLYSGISAQAGGGIEI